MKFTKEMLRLYAVTDRAWTGKMTLIEQIEAALSGGVTCLQLREKNLSDKDFLAEAVEVKKLCEKYKVPLIINDNVKVAIECNADGVHVGQSDMAAGNVRELIGKDKIIGVSVHDLAEASAAKAAGADYLGVGAMFPTATKNDATYVSYATLQEIIETVKLPTVAIGGINMKNLHELANSGIDGVALVSAIFAAEDIKGECEKLRAEVEKIAKK